MNATRTVNGYLSKRKVTTSCIFPMSPSECISYLMNEAGLSANEISLLLGVSEQAIWFWLHAKVTKLSYRSFKNLLILYCKVWSGVDYP